MPLSEVTISYDLSDLTGETLNGRSTKVWATTNVPGDTVIDTDGNQIRLGTGSGVHPDEGPVVGTIEVWAPGTGSNPASWQTYIHVDYPDRHKTGGRGKRTFGPFTITASANLADLVAEQEVPAEYVTTLTTELDTYATAAATSADEAATSAALAKSVADIETPDALVATLAGDPASETGQVLSATYGPAAMGNPESDLNSATVTLIGSTVGSIDTIPQINDARGNLTKARIGVGPQLWLIDPGPDPVQVADGDIILPVAAEPVPWSPLMLSGLAGWFDAQQLGLADAAQVDSWTNLAGGTDATQTTASARPVVDIDKINGHPAVVADGTDDTLIFPVTPYVGAVTVYIVGGTDLADNTSGSDMFLSAVDSGNVTNKFDLYRTTTEAYTLARGTTIASAGAAWGAGATIIRAVGNGAASSIAVDGATVASGTVQSSHEVAQWTMFSRASGAYFPGYIGELIVVHGTVSPEDDATVMAYLTDRWGL